MPDEPLYNISKNQNNIRSDQGTPSRSIHPLEICNGAGGFKLSFKNTPIPEVYLKFDDILSLSHNVINKAAIEIFPVFFPFPALPL